MVSETAVGGQCRVHAFQHNPPPDWPEQAANRHQLNPKIKRPVDAP
jgi:hypothetical protein